jgi:hypothetical protein
MTTSNPNAKHAPPQKDTAARKAALADNPITTLPAIAKSTALATPDARTAIQKWQDANAPATIVGRLMKFSKGGYTTRDDEEPISDNIDFIAPVDQMMVGLQKFNKDAPPDQVVGLPYDAFETPPRESLGDNDKSKWEIGLDNKPADPWQPTAWLVLQRVDTGEMFTFTTSSNTGRRAVGNLTKH